MKHRLPYPSKPLCALFCLSLLPVFNVGCGKQEDAKPAPGSTYYEGPMVPKSTGGAAESTTPPSPK